MIQIYRCICIESNPKLMVETEALANFGKKITKQRLIYKRVSVEWLKPQNLLQRRRKLCGIKWFILEILALV